MRIKQIITNLLANAVKYTESGKVVLTIDYTKASEDEIELRVSVQDTGYGIRPEDLGRLFNAFDRIDREHARKIEGTGLGLNIAQQLLSLMGSRLELAEVYDDDGVRAVMEELGHFAVPAPYAARFEALRDAVRQIDWDAIRGLAEVFFKEESEHGK